MAISAFSEEVIERSGLSTIEDLQRHVPTLQYTNLSTFPIIAIRGIGYENTTSGGDPGVAFHLDGVYLARPAATLFGAWDLERMEVLRGPQGTLYGRNTTGGSINVITRKPTDEFEANGELTFGNYDQVRGRATVNIPVTSRFAMRLTASAERRDGYQRNLVPGGTESGDADDHAVRGHFSYRTQNGIDLLLSGTYSRSDGVGVSPKLAGFPAPERLGPPGVAANWVGFVNGGGPDFSGLTPIPDPHVVRKDTPERAILAFDNVTATVSKDFGAFVLRSITGYAESSFDNYMDIDSSERFLYDAWLWEEQDQWSQELQIASSGDGALEWLFGAYVMEEEGTRFSYAVIDDFDRFAAARGREYGLEVGGTVEARAYALFTQASYDITPTLKLTGGARYSWDEKDALITLLSAFPNPAIAVVDITRQPAQGRWSEPTWKGVLEWRARNNLLTYLSYSRGYKSGGININVRPVEAAYDPEYVDAFEAGIKSQFAGRYQLNVSAFYNDYSDLQVQTFGNTGRIIANAAEATMQGVELEFIALITDRFEVNGSVGYLDAEYDEFRTFLDTARTQPIDLAGNELNRAPEVTVSVGAQQLFSLPGTLGSITLRGEWYHQSSQHFDQLNRPITRGPGYDNLNVRLFYRDSSERFSLEAFGTNLTDETQVGNIQLSVPWLAGGVGQVTYKPPRQYGLRLSLKY